MRSLIAVLLGIGLVAIGLALVGIETPRLTLAPEEDEHEPVFISEVIFGQASWYGPGFHGRTTASGVPYNRYALTAAHRTLRAGTVIRVTNLHNHRSTVLVINDWGPVPTDREIDVSEAAADVLGFREEGLAPVRIEVYRAATSSQ